MRRTRPHSANLMAAIADSEGLLGFDVALRMLRLDVGT
jgi:hypothetical protein